MSVKVFMLLKLGQQDTHTEAVNYEETSQFTSNTPREREREREREIYIYIYIYDFIFIGVRSGDNLGYRVHLD